MWLCGGLKGLVDSLDKRTEVLERKEIGEALIRVLGVDVLSKGLEMPNDMDLFLMLLIVLYLLLSSPNHQPF